MLEIDGSQGEGGGQIVRTSLALSMLTGKPIQLKNIRAGRKKPGLLRQHLTCVQAAKRICGASVEGAQLGAKSISFEPHDVQSGHYAFQLGTAGSTSLVAQTLLPALMLADDTSSIELTGGTHNPWAPPFEFLSLAFGGQLRKMGPALNGKLHAHGFYPAGGGKVVYEITPTSQLHGLELLERQGKLRPRVTAVVADLSRSIADRECNTIRRKSNWLSDCFEVQEVANPNGPGNVVMIRLEFDNVTEIFTGFGKPGIRAEQVARGVLREARSYLDAAVPVGEHLADQLLLPLGLAASQGQFSRFRTTTLSMHSRTHIDILHEFLDIEISIESDHDHHVLVQLRP